LIHTPFQKAKPSYAGALLYVLQEFGSRLCAAGLVDEHALTRALTAAAKHIEANLFTGEAG